MTTQIGNHGLFCLDDEDYAAVALAMQCNAEATDASLSEVNSELNTYLSRPWITVTNPNAVVVDDASGTLGPEGLVGEILRPTAATTIQVNGMAPIYVTSDLSTMLPRGLWLIGASVNWTLGALTANSIRRLLVYGVRRINGVANATTNFTDLYQIQDYQGDGGANGALTVCGFLDNTAGDVAFIASFFSHANTASDITIGINQWRLWATYLGSGVNF